MRSSDLTSPIETALFLLTGSCLMYELNPHGPHGTPNPPMVSSFIAFQNAKSSHLLTVPSCATWIGLKFIGLPPGRLTNLAAG